MTTTTKLELPCVLGVLDFDVGDVDVVLVILVLCVPDVLFALFLLDELAPLACV